VSRTLQLEGITSLRIAIERAKTIKLIQESNFEQRKKMLMLKVEEKTKIIIILMVILIGMREIAKRISEIILKGKRGSLIKINSRKVKIIKERELEVGKNAGSAGERGVFRSVRVTRKTRNSRAL